MTSSTDVRGLLITFEGPDGSGKSTQAQLLFAALKQRGLPSLLTREPGGTPLGDALRQVILDPASPPASALAMTLMYSASRAQLVETLIRPALDAGNMVITDRYADSTLAYQSWGLGVPVEDVRAITQIATGGLKPDVTIYVDIEPEVGVARLTQRGSRDRLDALALDFHRRVREGYHALIAEDPRRWLIVDGSGTTDDVQVAIMKAIEPRLREGAGAV